MNLKSNESPRFGVKPVAIGVLVSVLVSVMSIALLAFLLGKGSVGEGAIGVITKIITAISSLIGCMVCAFLVNKRIAIYSGICASVYVFILVVVNVLFFDGEFTGLIWTLVFAAIAVVISTLLRGRGLSRSHNTKWKFR